LSLPIDTRVARSASSRFRESLNFRFFFFATTLNPSRTRQVPSNVGDKLQTKVARALRMQRA
jgi:hypothetical protein